MKPTRHFLGPTLATLGLLAVLLPAPPAAATNGMYMTGYGAETMGRGGANLAISDRSLALNFNPAGIGQLQGNHFTLNLSLLAPQLEYQNTVNDTIQGEDDIFPLPAFAYVRSGKETPWSWGVGFVAQGGMGATFRHENTFFGTVDETYSEVRFMTVSPTVAYSFSEDMAVGASLNLGYADASFKFFPETSFFNPVNPAMSFPGVDMERAGGLQTNLRVGWWWRAHPRLAMGAIYQTETESDFDGGAMTVNFTGFPGLERKVRYDAKIDGFTFAAQAGVGIAARPGERWVVALDLKRYFWDHAIDTITVTATDPDVEGAPPELVYPFVFNWKDQWVVAVGADYRVSDLLTVRAGYNYGENPVPDDTLNPLFPATTERHASFGISYLLGNKLVEVAVERAFSADRVNGNPDFSVNQFGPGSRVEHSQWTTTFGISWALDRGRVRIPSEG
jgi:long-chain fatty acid transport protein